MGYSPERKAAVLKRMLPPNSMAMRQLSQAEGISEALNDAGLAEYCRKRGLYPAPIAAWRSACEQANDWDRASTARLGQATKNEKKRIKDLERELARKDRALAETAALLGLRKKASAIRGDEKRSGASQIKPFGGRFDAPNEDA